MVQDHCKMLPYKIEGIKSVEYVKKSYLEKKIHQQVHVEVTIIIDNVQFEHSQLTKNKINFKKLNKIKEQIKNKHQTNKFKKKKKILSISYSTRLVCK